MHIGDICEPDVVTCVPDTSLVDAAMLMRERHVGELLIVIQEPDGLRPVGLVTDRDIIVEVVALGLPTDRLTVGDIMSRKLVYVHDAKDPFDTLALMRHNGIRRLPVVNDLGKLVGIVTLDDLLQNIAEEMGLAAKLIEQKRQHETNERPRDAHPKVAA